MLSLPAGFHPFVQFLSHSFHSYLFIFFNAEVGFWKFFWIGQWQ
jgi:hypothetical protein